MTETRGDINPTHCHHAATGEGPEETLGRTRGPVATDDAITETVEGNQAVGSDSDKEDF